MLGCASVHGHTVATQFTLFETAIGRCGIAWSERGLVGVQLPEAADARHPRPGAEALPGRPGGPADRGCPAGHAGHRRRCCADEPRDLSASSWTWRACRAFHQRVYRAARVIPPGQTLSYGDIAQRVGSPGSARAVGQALGRNPFAIVVPCHRVLAAGGKVGGFSANGGIDHQAAHADHRGGAARRRRRRASAAELTFSDGGTLGFDPRAAVAHIRKVEPALGRVIDAVGSFDLRVDPRPQPVLGAGPGHRLPAAERQGGGHHLRAGEGAVPGREGAGRRSTSCRRPTSSCAGRACRARSSWRCGTWRERTAAGQLPTLAQIQRMDDEAIIERLTEVRGIGRWTVQMLLIFRLGRPDVLAVDDYGVRKGFSIAFGKRKLPAPTRSREARRALGPLPHHRQLVLLAGGGAGADRLEAEALIRPAAPGCQTEPPMPAPLKALLGPTNTGKTHRAIERMLEHDSGMIGLPLRLLAREVYDRVTARVGESAVALVTGEEKRIPAAPALLDLHRRGHAAGAARSTSWRWTRCSWPPTGSAGTCSPIGCCTPGARSETWFLGSATIGPLLERLCPAAVIEGRPRLSTLSDAGSLPLSALPAAIGGGGVLGHPGVRAGRAAARQARRGGGGDRGAVAPGAQRPGGAVPVGRGRHAGGHRRHRHGPEPGRRQRGVRGPAQVRRAPGARRWRTPSWRRSPGAPAATCATAASPRWSRCRRCRRRRCARWSATASPPTSGCSGATTTWIWRRWTGCWRR